MTPNKSVHDATSEEEIVNAAWKLTGSDDRILTAYNIEMVRRNNVALRVFNGSSDRWSRRLSRLTLGLIVLTVVLIIVAAESMYLAWVLLERSR
jgi:hypothetical protein